MRVTTLLFFLVFLLPVPAARAQVNLVKDINPGVNSGNPNYLTDAGGVVFFAASTAEQGIELWKSNGTTAGTVLVKDLYPGPGHGDPRNLTNFNGTLFFQATDGINGIELWMSDGTEVGTVMVKDLAPGAASGFNNSFVERWAVLGNTLFFVPNGGVIDRELWKTDGTPAGTVQVADIRPGPGGGSPSSLTASGNLLYFNGTNGVNGLELWKSDGTQGGTVMVKDIYPGLDSPNSSTPFHLTDVGGILYFSAADNLHGEELWMSNGTDAGTVMVKDIYLSGFFGSQPRELTNVNGVLYFVATDQTNGAELWRSNGTEAGTVMVYDIAPGATSSNPERLINHDGTLYFSANDGTTGYELWKSAGGMSGAMLVRDIFPGNDGSPNFFRSINGRLWFSAFEPATGSELFTTDGTEAGTKRVADINPGGPGSGPQDFRPQGTLVLFRAYHNDYGVELWSLDPSGVPLPVELVAFDALVDDNSVVLRWTTASETNNAGFDLEHRIPDATDAWSQVAFVNGHSTSTTPHTYAYRVEDLAPGVHTFRLRQIDYDGAFAYSAEVAVSIAAPHALTLSANYPEPFSASTQLRFTVPSAGRAVLTVYDMLGRSVATLFEGMAEPNASHEVMFQAKGLPAGRYHGVLSFEGRRVSRSLTLTK